MAKYHVKIDGQGYLVVPGSYRRTAEGPGPWRWWWQRDFRGGDGRRWTSDELAFDSGYGVEVSDGGVGLGRSGASSYASVENGFSAMVGYGAGLYVGASSSGWVYQYTAAWVQFYDTTKASVGSLAVHDGKLYAGSGSDGDVFVYDGAAWALAFTVPGAAGISCLCPYSVWDAGTSKTVPRLFVGVQYAAGQAKVFVWDGAAATEAQAAGEAWVRAMVVYEGRLYVATADVSGSQYGRILACDGRQRAGEWEQAAYVQDDYLVSLCVFDGLIYAGGASVKLYAFDGARLVEAYDFTTRGVAVPGLLYGMGVQGNRLVVGFNHPTDGAGLLCKLSSGALRPDGVAVVAGGGRPELGSVGRGWYMPSGSGAAGSVRSLAVWKGITWFARDAAGAATIYRRPGVGWRLSGQAELSLWRGEGPGPWAVRRVAVEHDPLAAGRSVAVYLSVDGGAYVLVGTSEVVGSASATFDVAPGTLATRVAVRVNLGAPDNTGGPVVRGVGLEAAPAAGIKRRWAFDARCEGVAGLPLRLLDNSLEAKTGAQLSAALWASRIARKVTLEDLDGTAYDAWFVELADKVGELDQGRGAQTRAACEIVEG